MRKGYDIIELMFRLRKFLYYDFIAMYYDDDINSYVLVFNEKEHLENDFFENMNITEITFKIHLEVRHYCGRFSLIVEDM